MSYGLHRAFDGGACRGYMCGVSGGEGKEYVFTPVARFFNDNPYEMLVSPNNPEYETFKVKHPSTILEHKLPE